MSSGESDEEEAVNQQNDSVKAKHKYQNKIHARLARGKRRQVEELLEIRVQGLLAHGDEYRRLVDEKYIETMRKSNQTAGNGQVLLEFEGRIIPLVLSEKLCGNCYKDEYIRQSEIMKMEASEDRSLCALPMLPDKMSTAADNQDAYIARRERNRIHAKRTRFRRKRRAELNKYLCREMEIENAVLRNYLFSIGVLTRSQIERYERELNSFKENVALIDRPTSYVDIEVPSSVTMTNTNQISSMPGGYAVNSNVATADIAPSEGSNSSGTGTATEEPNLGSDVNDFANLLINLNNGSQMQSAAVSTGDTVSAGNGGGSDDRDNGASDCPAAKRSRNDSERALGGSGADPIDLQAASGGRKKNKSYKKLQPYSYYSIRELEVRDDGSPFLEQNQNYGSETAANTVSYSTVPFSTTMVPRSRLSLAPQSIVSTTTSSSMPPMYPQSLYNHHPSPSVNSSPNVSVNPPLLPMHSMHPNVNMDNAALPSYIYYGLFQNSPLDMPGPGPGSGSGPKPGPGPGPGPGLGPMYGYGGGPGNWNVIGPGGGISGSYFGGTPHGPYGLNATFMQLPMQHLYGYPQPTPHPYIHPHSLPQNFPPYSSNMYFQGHDSGTRTQSLVSQSQTQQGQSQGQGQGVQNSFHQFQDSQSQSQGQSQGQSHTEDSRFQTVSTASQSQTQQGQSQGQGQGKIQGVQNSFHQFQDSQSQSQSQGQSQGQSHTEDSRFQTVSTASQSQTQQGQSQGQGQGKI